MPKEMRGMALRSSDISHDINQWAVISMPVMNVPEELV